METLDWCFAVLNYVFVFSLPGDVGNFFAKALSLVGTDWYGYVPQDCLPNNVQLSIADKTKAYSYKDCNVENWKQFESALISYTEIIEHYNLPKNSYSIWNKPTSYKTLESDIVGKDDCQHVFYIDPGNDFKWAVLNAFYKQFCIDVTWFKLGTKMLSDDGIHKLSLSNIITSKETCIQEIQKVVSIVGAALTPESVIAIEALWEQWHATTLKEDKFVEFANTIGFNL